MGTDIRTYATAERMLERIRELEAQRDDLAHAVMVWTKGGHEHGGNPYRLDFVRMADNIVGGGEWKS